MTTHLPSAPLVSIVMPTYNRAEYILETINSIQKQNYTAWELIIVDDGSDDNTRQIVNQVDDERINYYYIGHVGMEHSRKMGLEKAKGNYIGFMDSDDLWDPAKLQKQVKYLLENSQLAFTLTGGYEFKNLGEPLVFYYKQRIGINHGDLFIPFFQSKVVAATPSLLFRRECLDNVSFSETEELAHIHFFLRLARKYSGAILYEPLFFRRLHKTNYSTLNEAKRHHDGIQLIKCYKNRLPKQVFTDALFKSHINFGERCLKDHERLKAIREFIQAWKHKPLNIIPFKKIVKAMASQEILNSNGKMSTVAVQT